jgi:hypothetical protein
MVGLVCRQPPFSKIRTRFSSNFSTGISEGCLPFFLIFFFYFLLSSRGCCVYIHTRHGRERRCTGRIPRFGCVLKRVSCAETARPPSMGECSAPCLLLLLLLLLLLSFWTGICPMQAPQHPPGAQSALPASQQHKLFRKPVFLSSTNQLVLSQVSPASCLSLCTPNIRARAPDHRSSITTSTHSLGPFLCRVQAG